MSSNSDFVLENIINEERFRLKNGTNTIGRDNVNTIRLQSPLVSRKHCTIMVNNGRIFIRDEGSSNGIYINNRQITERLLIELRHNDLVGIGAVIEKGNDEDINTKMVFKLFILPMKTDFNTQLSPETNATQIFQPKESNLDKSLDNKTKSIDVIENVIVNEFEAKNITSTEATKGQSTNINGKIMSVAIGSNSPEYCPIVDFKNNNEIQESHSTKDKDNEFRVGMFENEIVISDDEEYFFSQSMLNKVKEDLAELDDVICVTDDEEVDGDKICLESKEVFDSWRQLNATPIKNEATPILNNQTTNFQPSTMNWMYSQSDVLLCKKKTEQTDVSRPGDSSEHKIDYSNKETHIINKEKNNPEKSKRGRTRSTTQKKGKIENGSKHKNDSDKKKSHSKSKASSKYSKSSLENQSKKKDIETVLRSSSSKKSDTKKKKESDDNKSVDSNSKEANKIQRESRTRSSSKDLKKSTNKNGSKSKENDGSKKQARDRSSSKDMNSKSKEEFIRITNNIKNLDLEKLKKSTLRRRSKSLSVARSEIKSGLPITKQDKISDAKELTEPKPLKAPPIKKRRLTEFTSTIEYRSPLESPVGTKRKQTLRKSVRFDDNLEKVEFLKPAVPCPIKKPHSFTKPVQHSKHIDKGNELFKLILSWDPEWLKTLKPEINGVNPTLVPVLNKFESHTDYKNVFYPLVKEEIWATMTKNYVLNKPFKVYISNIFSTDCLYLKCVSNPDLYYVTPNDIIIVYVGNKNSSFKMFAQVTQITPMNNKERILEITSKCNKIVFDFIKNEHIKEAHFRVVFPKLDVEAGTYSAIENMKNSPLVDLILNPLRIIQNVNDHKIYKYCGFTSLNKEQEELVLQSYAMSLNSKVPSIKLIEGPPGTGKSRLIQNIVYQLLYGQEVSKKPRILVCAQSNTAVDIIMRKLIDERKKYGTKLIRYGVDSSMHRKVSPFSVNSFVMHEWHGKEKYRVIPDCRLLELREKEILNRLQQLKCSNNKNAETDEMKKLEIELKKIRLKMSITKQCRFKLTKYFLSNAEVVCTTLPSCVRLFNSTQQFDICIIDEATQCTEPWSLMPLQFGIKHFILVGDTQQLPATVTSMTAQNHRFGQSLFSRIQNSLKTEGVTNYAVGKLTVQYRMHPEISAWPNEYFYDKCLQNAEETMNQISVFKPFSMFNIARNKEKSSIQENYTNFNEIEFIFKLVKHMKNKMSASVYSYGVITPYAKQRDELIKKFSKEKDKICIDTIDSVQGVERDIVIYSNTRTNGIGFLVNPQRLNVALTRAKKCLIVVGTFENLSGCTRKTTNGPS
ncbi:SETX.2 family protein [Megaselia abdita]